MGNFRFPGPVCRSQLTHQPIKDGTLASVRSPVPSLSRFRSRVGLLSGRSLALLANGSAAVTPVKSRTRPTARGQCAYLNPETSGRVKVPLEAFERLRKKSGPAPISAPRILGDRKAWPKAAEWPDQRQHTSTRPISTTS